MVQQYLLSNKKWVSVANHLGKKKLCIRLPIMASGITSSAMKSSSVKLSKAKFKGLASKSPYIKSVEVR